MLVSVISILSSLPRQLLKKLNRPHEAVLQFSWALDFNRSSGNTQIREEIDQVYHPQDTSALEQSNDSDFIPHSDPVSDNEGGDGSDASMQSFGDDIL